MWIRKNTNHPWLTLHPHVNYVEIITVITLGLGYFIASAIHYRFIASLPPWNAEQLLSILVIETTLGALTLSYLWTKHYPFAFDGTFTKQDLAWTASLLITQFGMIYLAHLSGWVSSTSSGLTGSTKAAWWVIALFAIANAIYEEILLLGYLVRRLYPQGIAIALFVSILVRLAYHLHYSLLGLGHIVLLGSLVSISYGLTRRIQPAVATHAFYDIIALSY